MINDLDTEETLTQDRIEGKFPVGGWVLIYQMLSFP